MLSDKDSRIIINSLNAFQSSYRNYDICIISWSELTSIIGVQNFEKLQCIIPFKTGDIAGSEWACIKSHERSDDELFCKVPQTVMTAFRLMNNTLLNDSGLALAIVSGFRSPAYQLMILLKEIYAQNYNVAAARRLVALPGESEHQNPTQTALDFDISNEKDERYRWLSSHAKQYGFVLSYPKNNAQAMRFEPWHWHFEPIQAL